MISRRHVTVEQGSVLVNDIWVVASRPRLFAIEADCHTKYAEVLAYAGAEVMFYASERTLKAGDTDKPTVITLPPRMAGWRITADASRYTLTITAFKPRHRRRYRDIWRSPVEHFTAGKE